MHLDDRIHRQAARLGQHRRRIAVGQDRHHHQHRIGARRARLRHLCRIDDEILGKDRPVEPGPNPPQIIERTAEIFAVGQHADRVGNRRIGAHGLLDRDIAAMPRRRRALDLHHEARAGPGECRAQAARGRFGRDRARQARGDFAALSIDNPGEHVSHCWPRHRRRAPLLPVRTGDCAARARRPGGGRPRGPRSSAARRC